jgi:hypothetical protein
MLMHATEKRKWQGPNFKCGTSSGVPFDLLAFNKKTPLLLEKRGYFEASSSFPPA